MKKQKPVDEQVLRGDALTIEEVKEFIVDSNKKRQDWLTIADRSWNEIDKRNKKGRLYGGNDLDRARRWTRFPLWWSCWKIRQPITLARLPIPVLKDTQGDDPVGRTACVIGERLTRGILKTFDAFDEFTACNDDFLITNFGWGRVYYKSEECLEAEKLRLQIVEHPAPKQIGLDGMLSPAEPIQILVDPDGNQVMDTSQVLEDEFGPYLLTGQQITVDNEQVCFEAQPYSGLYVDPDAKQWNQITRLAFEYPYSYREFKKKFGKSALDKLARGDIEEHKSGKPILVYEYHDKYLKETRWFAENSEDFFQPLTMNMSPEPSVDGLEEVKEPTEYDHSDLYGLTGFFPCAKPLIINASTREFWPTPEYFQVMDIIEDIHQIVSRMFLLTKAIRVRFLFDSSVTELKSLISEMGEGGGIGIPNLQNALMNGKGDLKTLVAYFPTDEMITGLNNMYVAFQQRLDMFYKLIGINDLIQGQTSDADKTYGERQLEGKFALNRFEPYQRAVQEWIKDNYQLLMEMALKMFSEKSLDEYITPQTLDPEDKQRYQAGLELLKSNKRSRFRVDFETDATASINEMWKRKQAIETANVITKMQESIAKTAQDMPELAESQLKIMQHVVGELTDGKLFLDEITESIQQVIDKVNQPKEPEPNLDMMKIQIEQQRLQLDGQKMSADAQLEQLKIQANQQIEVAKIARDDRLAGLESQLAQFKLQSEQQLQFTKLSSDAQVKNEELEQQYQKISADIMLAQQELSLKRDELLIELRKIVDKKEVDQFALMIDERVAGFEAQLETAKLELEKQHGALELQERFITEQRLQAEHQLQLGYSKIESLEKIVDVALKKKELDAPIEIKQPDAPKETPKAKKKKSKVVRDKNGDIAEIIHSEED